MAVTKALLSIEDLNKLTRNPKSHSIGSDHGPSSESLELLWGRLLETIQHPSVSDKHMTAACNGICFVVRTCSHSSHEDVRSFAFAGDTWTQAFGAARCAFASGKNKPALQVLDTLAYLAESNPIKQQISPHVTKAAIEMQKIIFTQQPRSSLKKACIVLFFFLRKLSYLVSFSDILEQAFVETRACFARLCRVSGVVWHDTAESSPSPWFAFVLSLLMIVRVAESKSATLKLLSLLCVLPNALSGVDMVSMVHEAIGVYSAAHESALEDVSRDVLPTILTTIEQYNAFLATYITQAGASESTVQVIIALLHFGKKRGFVSEMELPTLIKQACLHDSAPTGHVDDYAGFHYLLSSSSAAIRYKSYELLAYSTSPKVPLPSGALRCLVESLHFLHDDTDAFDRGELLSTSRRLVTRLLHNTGLEAIDTFLSDYLSFLRSELALHVSHGRHILALNIIGYMAETIPHQLNLSQATIWADHDMLSLLFSLLLDPYDDVRIAASEILSCLTRRIHKSDASAERQAFQHVFRYLQPLHSTSKLAAASNRADHADALGRVIKLTYAHPLNDMLTEDNGSQEHDLNSLVGHLHDHVLAMHHFDTSSTFPLHGHVLGTAYMIGDVLHLVSDLDNTSMQEKLLESCRRIWTLSQTHLCVDSPEMETEMMAKSETMGPKDLLAYAWRALRDSNVLMQAMLERLKPEQTLLRAIGDLCFEQLSLLRHRGAFSTVAQTFVACCQKSRGVNDQNSHCLVDSWFERALWELEEQADKLTRRSAGLPAIFIGLLHPYDASRFTKSFQALVQIAMRPQPSNILEALQDKIRLPQVHALNCIKDIMTTSRFRAMTEPLVVSTINLAAECMESSIWAIKNCGLMLLRASINRLDPDTSLGDRETDPMGSRASDGLIRPLDIALKLLGNAAGAHLRLSESPDLLNVKQDINSGAEGEFAGLDLLGRLYITGNEVLLVRTMVTKLLSHNIWHIRAQAARLLTHLTPEGEELSTILALLRDLTASGSINYAHGKLLTMHALMSRSQGTTIPQDRMSRIASLLIELAGNQFFIGSSILSAMWLETTTELLKSQYLCSDWGKLLYQATKQLLQRDLITYRSLWASHAHYDRAVSAFLMSTPSFVIETELDELELLLDLDKDAIVQSLIRYSQIHTVTSPKPMFDLLTSLLHHHAEQDVKATATSTICFLLGQVDNNTLNSVLIHRLIDQLDFRSLGSREFTKSQLKLYSCLVNCVWRNEHTEDYRHLSSLAAFFLISLRAIANDDVDDSTRAVAVEALQALKSVHKMPEMLTSIFGINGRVELLSILYDLLNDDDDEIRLAATELATAYVDQRGGALCAAASRQKLRQYLVSSDDSNLLLVECVRRLFGMEMAVSRHRLQGEIPLWLEQNPAANHVSGILSAVNDLFAEERKNLYVDEIAEIRAWAIVARKLSIDAAGFLPAAIKWTQNAITSLDELLGSGKLTFGLGASCDLEILLVRVIMIARVFGSFEGELHGLALKCDSAHMSRLVTSAFTWSLE